MIRGKELSWSQSSTLVNHLSEAGQAIRLGNAVEDIGEKVNA